MINSFNPLGPTLNACLSWFRATFSHGQFVAVVGSVLLLSGCVSSTLDSASQQANNELASSNKTQNTSELALASEEQVNDARQQAINDIRRKADAVEFSEAAPDLATDRRSDTRPLNEAEIKAKSNQLATRNAQSQNQLPDAELAAKKRTMAELRRKAGSHYSSAINSIEKTQ